MRHILLLTWTELVTIEEPTCSKEILALLSVGIKKRLRIVYRPFAGNKLFFYDHNLRLIQDPLSFFQAEVIIFSNIPRRPREPLEGLELMDQEVEIHGLPSRMNHLRLAYREGFYTFRDEYSLAVWSRNAIDLGVASAYIQ